MKIVQLGKSTADENEILNILNEECSEVIQAVSKVFRFGWESCDPRKPNYSNRAHLTEEIGDLLCMVKILTDKGIINEESVTRAMWEKMNKLKRFSNIDLSYLETA